MKQINPEDLSLKPFCAFDCDWALLSAGNKNDFNTMTVSWGGLGTLWGVPVATAYVRPQRFTYEFMERERFFSLSFFNGHKDALAYLGSHSGRNDDKLAKTDLTPRFDNLASAPMFSQSTLTLVCKKAYFTDIKPDNIIDRGIVVAKNYPNNDFHRIYIGEVVQVLVKE